MRKTYIFKDAKNVKIWLKEAKAVIIWLVDVDINFVIFVEKIGRIMAISVVEMAIIKIIIMMTMIVVNALMSVDVVEEFWNLSYSCHFSS